MCNSACATCVTSATNCLTCQDVNMVTPGCTTCASGFYYNTGSSLCASKLKQFRNFYNKYFQYNRLFFIMLGMYKFFN